MTRDMWMDEVERITDDFCFEQITLEEGISALKRIGFDVHEAETLLKEAIA